MTALEEANVTFKTRHSYLKFHRIQIYEIIVNAHYRLNFDTYLKEGRNLMLWVI